MMKYLTRVTTRKPWKGYCLALVRLCPTSKTTVCLRGKNPEPSPKTFKTVKTVKESGRKIWGMVGLHLPLLSEFTGRIGHRSITRQPGPIRHIFEHQRRSKALIKVESSKGASRMHRVRRGYMGKQPAVLLIGLKFKWTLEAFGVEVVFTYVR